MDADGDRTFELELNELRLRGLAHVINVRGPPEVDEGEGRVVLSTIEHRVESVLALSFDDASEVVTTPNHPFYSVSRGWTSAGELQLGEAVETPDGERTLVFAEYEGAAQSVFNLEVERDHEYLVGGSGLRVHNTYPERLPDDATVCRGGSSTGEVLAAQDPAGARGSTEVNESHEDAHSVCGIPDEEWLTGQLLEAFQLWLKHQDHVDLRKRIAEIAFSLGTRLAE